MKVNQFHNCASAISDSYLDAIEANLGRKLPQSFRNHYLKYNGGNPTNQLVPCNSQYDSIEVTGFYPMKFNTSAYFDINSLFFEHYEWMRSKDVIPDFLLPFAHDPGGNFFCINIKNGNIIFYAPDAFSKDVDIHQNQCNAQRLLADSFENFMELLEYNDELDSDEWPE